jgi:hypothetical protein
MPRCQMCIAKRHAQGTVTHDLLDEKNVTSVHYQTARRSVPEPVPDGIVNPRFLKNIVEPLRR